jgi:hypothetical protein
VTGGSTIALRKPERRHERAVLRISDRLWQTTPEYPVPPRDERKGHHQREWSAPPDHQAGSAIKQLANKAASGDKRAIQDMLRFQTMLFPDAPMTSSESANSKHPPPPDADPAKVALVLLHVLRAADATRESESAG